MYTTWSQTYTSWTLSSCWVTSIPAIYIASHFGEHCPSRTCFTKIINKFDYLVSTLDIILGNDFLSVVGMNSDSTSATIKCFNHVIPWEHYKDLPKAKFNIVQAMMLSIEEQWIFWKKPTLCIEKV